MFPTESSLPTSPSLRTNECKARLVALAEELGFASCRVAACTPPPHADAFKVWLSEGAAGEMGYMARGAEKRCDPQQVLPGAHSVVVVAMNYWQGPDALQSSSFPQGAALSRAPAQINSAVENRRSLPAAVTGRIARYAWGDDYHDVIAEKLGKLDAFLQQFGGTQKVYVDTGPVLERDYAAQAGIGWHGKSTMLIDTRLGTWFFLAEILTTLDLSADPPQTDRCGTCDRCMTACPTGAITTAHRLDARRCISYLTIELKTAIPEEFRPLIGDRIFGCDACLDACPWNRFAEASRETVFAARTSTVGMALRDYLRLNDDDFRTLFRRSPIKRIKRKGFLRNVCVALGNVGDTGDLPALEQAAADPDRLIAEHATWAIERIRLRCGDGPAENRLNPGPRPEASNQDGDEPICFAKV